MPMVAVWKQAYQEEVARVGRFVLVGAGTVGCYVLFYAFLSRVLWPTGNRTVENALATCLMAVMNFYAHKRWTFRAQTSALRSGRRYIVVLVTASLMQFSLFWLGHAVLHLHDLLVAIAVPAIIPCYTFIMHRFYTFRAHV